MVVHPLKNFIGFSFSFICLNFAIFNVANIWHNYKIWKNTLQLINKRVISIRRIFKRKKLMIAILSLF